MRDGIEVQKIFSIADCKANPNKIYVFGDNLVYQGTGGQAIIRYCPNAFGIPTKRLPSSADDAYFSDQDREMSKVLRKLAQLTMMYSYENKTLVFPADGLGTGRAKLREKSPRIYELIKDFLKEQFDLEIMP